MKFKTLSALALAAAFLFGNAYAYAENNLNLNKYQTASELFAYPVPAYGIPTLTPAPAGYEPFHMEHYGRHGSRWLIDDKVYSEPVKILAHADSLGKLTSRGKKLLEQMSFINAESTNRLGELTPLGHRQHQQIADRMTKNFPQLFTNGTHVDAKSTMVIRCILSMANEVTTLKLYNPNMLFTFDASRTTQNILAADPVDTVAKRIVRENRHLATEFGAKHRDTSAFFSKIFSDPQYVADNIDTTRFFTQIFQVASNAQSHDNLYDLYDLFTEQELLNEWTKDNAKWYIESGNTSLTNNRVPWKQSPLLRNIIESADTAMISPRKSVNLRFGHESMLLPLTVLMEINNSSVDTDNFDELSGLWRNYTIFPMGSNLQFIFYRPIEDTPNPDKVLVKVLLNEAEATLPLTPVSGPYYKWTDVRTYYVNKLNSFASRFER
jgi:hypothetical protein